MTEISTVARPYAKAAFEAALKTNTLQGWGKTLAQLTLVVADPKIQELISSPSVEAVEKAETILAVLAEKSLPDGLDQFVGLLAENQRISAIPAIQEQFETLKSEHERYVDVDVQSAFELDSQQEKVIADKLSQRLDRKINLKTSVDASLIGGVVIRTGDLVIDHSVRGRLNKLAETLMS